MNISINLTVYIIYVHALDMEGAKVVHTTPLHICSGKSRIFERRFQLLAKAPAQFELQTKKITKKEVINLHTLLSVMFDAFSLHYF